MIRRLAVFIVVLAMNVEAHAGATIHIKTPMVPPTWALLERELLRANTAACKEFFERYFDERGYFRCVTRWGGNDGPDDAIENCTDWPILHALGAADDVLRMYKKAWEGHLRQYTEARTTHVPFARDGMYFKEFPVMFDWLHHTEGLTVFCMQGLSDSTSERHRQRARRYAGFYLNEDPGAPNYDPKHKIIRSMFTGSRGPLLRKATAVDWAGDPVEVANRFRAGHGERNYEEMLAHFKDYNDIIGDHPQNLMATGLALNAYMLTGESKYKNWLLEYVNAWRERTLQNDGIIPTNVGLDGKIGSAAGGKWYGGVYGWGFSVKVPQTGQLAHRNGHGMGLAGFLNACLLTGDDRYLDVWRKMIARINSHGRTVAGKMAYPRMYGDQGWYHFVPERYRTGATEIWYLSMAEADRVRVADDPWLQFLAGKNADFPEQALRHDFAAIRQRVAAMRQDTTTPDTRLADDALQYNPATTHNLTRLMLGGLPTGNKVLTLHCRVRYFDPGRRRAGLPEDVAALVEELSADKTALTLVNVNQLEPRTVIIQGGAYGEHQLTTVTHAGQTQTIDMPIVTIKLDPGAGARLRLGTKRFANTPTLTHPWDRE